MRVPRVDIIKGDVLFSDLANFVNGLLSVAHPHLRQQLVESSLVLIPDTAEGALFKVPALTDVAVKDSRGVEKILLAEDYDLLGFPVLRIGMRVAFRVGDAHLTIGRRERTLVLPPGACARFEFVYDDDTLPADCLQWLGCGRNATMVAATEEEARRLLPA